MRKAVFDRTSTAVLVERTKELSEAFQRNDFDYLSNRGAILTEEGHWEYWLQESDLPISALRIPRLLLWSSRMPRSVS
jgi:hypothetical protein